MIPGRACNVRSVNVKQTEHPECHLQFILVFGMSVSEPDLLQVEDSGRDPLDSVHHPLRIWRPLASHCNVLVQV